MINYPELRFIHRKRTTMKKIIVLPIFLTFTFSVFAQINVHVREDNTISRMMYHMVQNNQLDEGVSGWRIQVLATTDRRKLEDVKEKFQRTYPEVNVDWKHDKPYYKLRAGAFSSKLEAARLLYRLKREFPSAYPAKDNNINPREFIQL